MSLLIGDKVTALGVLKAPELGVPLRPRLLSLVRGPLLFGSLFFDSLFFLRTLGVSTLGVALFLSSFGKSRDVLEDFMYI